MYSLLVLSLYTHDFRLDVWSFSISTMRQFQQKGEKVPAIYILSGWIWTSMFSRNPETWNFTAFSALHTVLLCSDFYLYSKVLILLTKCHRKCSWRLWLHDIEHWCINYIMLAPLCVSVKYNRQLSQRGVSLSASEPNEIYKQLLQLYCMVK